jgi:hypothetical protein
LPSGPGGKRGTQTLRLHALKDFLLLRGDHARCWAARAARCDPEDHR